MPVGWLELACMSPDVHPQAHTGTGERPVN